LKVEVDEKEKEIFMNEDINIGAISEALNNKMDRDTLNASDTGNIIMAGLGMPSDTYIDLTLNADGATYIAPANGWFTFWAMSADNSLNWSMFHNLTASNLSTGFVCPSSTSRNCIMMPCKKGDTVQLFYGNIIVQYFRFIYSTGSESEAS
jgi:hypothetical protein